MKVVLVLGGGGAKSIAHAGAWRALREQGAEIVHIVGTSMGAVLGAAFAGGSTPEQVVETARSLKARDIAMIDPLAFVKGLFATSLLKASVVKRTIGRFVSATRFADLRIPLTVTTTDVESGELVLFGAGTAIGPVRHLGADAPLLEVLYASCALPLYFPPAELCGRRLGDGGLRTTLPIEVAAGIGSGDLVVAVDVGPGFDEPPAPPRSGLLPPPLIRAHGEAIRIMMAAETERAIAAWPERAPRLVVVRAVAEREATFARGQTDRYVAAGYAATRAALANDN